MSLTNDIRKLIDIQDSHITFEKDFFEMGTLKGQKCKFIKGQLYTYTLRCLRHRKSGYTLYKTGRKLRGFPCLSLGCIRLIYS